MNHESRNPFYTRNHIMPCHKIAPRGGQLSVKLYVAHEFYKLSDRQLLKTMLPVARIDYDDSCQKRGHDRISDPGS